MRGDNVIRGRARVIGDGSPPRAWGQQSPVQENAIISRFTPTCVGTTGLGLSAHPGGAVHPHVRGDNPRGHILQHKSDGSPPRAWGQRPWPPAPVPPLRFTPTCVGTTRGAPLPRGPGAVHPHVRGDNIIFFLHFCIFSGSPPRAWGQQPQDLDLLFGLRFTPTCVGTTHDETMADTNDTVHPHVRGDNSRSCLPIQP